MSEPAERPEGVPSDAVDISDDGGLCKKILTAGDASAGTPFDGARVQVHYTGMLMDGSKFDSSRDRPGNFSFKIGQSEVIKGWDKGVATMHKGEKAELYCRSEYAYGDSGSPPKIPGGATLKFEVELLSWAKDRADMAAGEKIGEAKELKADATTKFKAGEFAAARSTYDEAVTWVEHEYEFVKDEDSAAATEIFISCLLNSAQCSLKLSDWPEAVSRCTTALGISGLTESSKVKALFRRGSARVKMSDFDLARTDLKEACTLDPKSREIREAYASVKEAEHAARKADAGLFAKMVKGAGGVKKKPPLGVPSDAVDISDDGGLCKKILTAGDASAGTPFDGARVQVHYTGMLMDGSKFDSSRDRPGNFSFKIGQSEVIKGWDKGVATMHKGEKAELYCRSDYAYGDSGSPPKIPGGATLKFEVELLSWAEDIMDPNGDSEEDDEEDADEEDLPAAEAEQPGKDEDGAVGVE